MLKGSGCKANRQTNKTIGHTTKHPNQNEVFRKIMGIAIVCA
jgi:hypothetical protein